ncbi:MULTISPECIES: hypothetical protein [Desulfitobacterium]|uniref:PQ-loop repeat-containing protein n=1 Tax=Desulfitobacterium dehalogenans (strain ATCC 51507 / DSM 9161 / JW/IU-DC1) TaxID=756499 RepID=I4AD12_DESDJ|nr:MULTISPECIES: hypothetical protein [Desulfitobacterium]AFM01847.1 hypothetical protein Desde_3568 [Desulfitobacterium dehalogenans ATCC 51507]
MSIFEALMLLSFGAAWPFSIYKSYISRSMEGKSPFFLVIIIFGYIAGILHKLFYQYDLVIYLYILNLLMVSADFLLYLRNSRLAKVHRKISESII